MEREHSLKIRPNEWINDDQYKGCTLIKTQDEEYKLVYGTVSNYSAWVLIQKDEQSWVYYPLGNTAYKSKPYLWIGDLLDAAVEDMVRSKL